MTAKPARMGKNESAGEPGQYRIVQTPDDVRKKISWNPFLSVSDMEKRGKENIEQIEGDARKQITDELSRLDRVLNHVVSTDDLTARDLREIGRTANDIRTLADSFDFEAIASICAAVVRFVSQPPSSADLRKSVIAALTNAIHVLRPQAGALDQIEANLELARAVNAMVRKTCGVPKQEVLGRR